MTKSCENIYKTCRQNAGLTQEQAAERLPVAVRSLSDYENGKIMPSDTIVKRMVELYNAPLLAIRHLKQNNQLGDFLPDVAMPQTNGDMAFQMVLAQEDLKATVAEIKRIMADGVIAEDEAEDFTAAIDCVKTVNAKLLSVIIYAGNRP